MKLPILQTLQIDFCSFLKRFFRKKTIDNTDDLLGAYLMLQEAVLVPHKAETEVTLDPGLCLPGLGQVQLQQVQVGAVPGIKWTMKCVLWSDIIY